MEGGGRKRNQRGAWVAQPVKRLTLGFGSGHDLTVHEFKPRIGLHADSVEPAWDSLSVSLSLPPPPTFKINKFKKRKRSRSDVM